MGRAAGVAGGPAGRLMIDSTIVRGASARPPGASRKKKGAAQRRRSGRSPRRADDQGHRPSRADEDGAVAVDVAEGAEATTRRLAGPVLDEAKEVVGTVDRGPWPTRRSTRTRSAASSWTSWMLCR